MRNKCCFSDELGMNSGHLVLQKSGHLPFLYHFPVNCNITKRVLSIFRSQCIKWPIVVYQFGPISLTMDSGQGGIMAYMHCGKVFGHKQNKKEKNGICKPQHLTYYYYLVLIYPYPCTHCPLNYMWPRFRTGVLNSFEFSTA